MPREPVIVSKEIKSGDAGWKGGAKKVGKTVSATNNRHRKPIIRESKDQCATVGFPAARSDFQPPAPVDPSCCGQGQLPI